MKIFKFKRTDCAQAVLAEIQNLSDMVFGGADFYLDQDGLTLFGSIDITLETKAVLFCVGFLTGRTYGLNEARKIQEHSDRNYQS